MAQQLKHGSISEAKASKNASKSKKPIIIIAVALVVAAAIGVGVFLFISNMHTNPILPKEEQIKKDLSSDKSVTEVMVGKTEYTFKIKDYEKKKDEATPDFDNVEKYSIWVSISRESDTYGIKPVEFKVNYTLDKGKMKYKSAEPLTKEISFTALAGADKDDAVKKAKKYYKQAKFKEQKTDLKKGVDNIICSIDNKEYEGTVTVVYKFDSKKGWLYKKVDDKNAKFRKGVTHKEDGLYTNTNIKNILFLGIDSADGVGRSDCMMLISIDKNTGTIKQTSFMRDNWFNLPGHGNNKLNAAYVFGGAELTVSTISNTFGIKIDNYAVVDFTTFKAVINALGGIDVNITSDEAGYINWQIKKNGQEAAVGLVSTKGGVTHLNGQQALWLCRDRGGGGFAGDDFDRTGRQRKVIQSIANTYKDLTPAKVFNLLKALKGNVKTDLTVSDLKWFADRSGKFFNYTYKERCVPDDGEWHSGTGDGGAWIISIDNFDKLKSEIQHDIYEDLK